MATEKSENVHGLGITCEDASAPPALVTIFGASGDLAARKLLPALFSLRRRSLADPRTRIVGCARTAMDDGAFRAKTAQWLPPDAPAAERDAFLANLHYVPVAYDSADDFASLSARLDAIEAEAGAEVEGRVFFLSTPYSVCASIVERLGRSGLAAEPYEGRPWRRVVIEKPFGRDLASARALERAVGGVLHERQIYRIDHYLGKETVQNIMMLRFANAIFEPVWNNHYIDNVQITVAEAIGIEGRSGYYEESGLLRDMFQNHMLQLLSLVAMEPPPSFDADLVRNEKIKLLNSIRPPAAEALDRQFVRAQYGRGRVAGAAACAYREEKGVSPTSRVETFVAARLLIDNWRWNGVPFYLRSGKRLPRRTSDIVITFKRVPHSIFTPRGGEPPPPDSLRLNIQPEEGLALSIQAKRPGSKLCMGRLDMDFTYSEVFGGASPDAYERLLLDCLLGDQTLFIRRDFIETSWSLLTPVLTRWEEQDMDPRAGSSLRFYPAGTWGPPESDELLESDGFTWHIR